MRTFCGERPCRAPQMAQSASRCLRRQKGSKRRWAEIAEGLRRAWIRKGVGCLLGGLRKKGRHSGLVWDQPFPRQSVSCGSPCQRTATSARRMASSSPRRSGDAASTPRTVPLRETLQHCPNVTLRVPWRKRELSLPPFYRRRN